MIPSIRPLRALLLASPLVCFAPLHADVANNLTVTGYLAATGDLDINGNTASFGTNGANAGYNLLYTPGSSAVLDFSATATAHTWSWRQGSTALQMQLTSANLLNLFRTGTTAPRIRATGLHANGIISDTADRPGFEATGHYPQLVLMAGGSANTSHGATVMLGAFDSGTSGAHKHWSIGTAGQNSGFLDFGYHSGTELNPHAGVRNYQGSTIMTLLSNGNVGIGKTDPTTKLEVAGNVKVTGTITSTSTITAPSITLPDGSVLSTARQNALYKNNGQPVATVVQSSGEVYFSNAISLPMVTLRGNNPATGSGFSLGESNSIGSDSAIALGYDNFLGEMSIALGNGNTAGGNGFAIGRNNTVTGSGYYEHPSAFAVGDGNEITGYGSGTIGQDNESKWDSVLNSEPFLTFTYGFGLIANAPFVTVMGYRNVPAHANDLFVIGNSVSYNGPGYEQEPTLPRSNALTIHKNGDTRIAGNLDVKGVVRVKPSGDISMGTFTATPVANRNPATLNAGLRYVGE